MLETNDATLELAATFVFARAAMPKIKNLDIKLQHQF